MALAANGLFSLPNPRRIQTSLSYGKCEGASLWTVFYSCLAHAHDLKMGNARFRIENHLHVENLNPDAPSAYELEKPKELKV